MRQPARAKRSLLGVNKFREFGHVRAGFENPIAARDACVQGSGFDVARHLLRADQEAFDFRVVY